MKNLLLLLLLGLSLIGRTQVFEFEYGAGIHNANIVREPHWPKHVFQENEKYFTKPSLVQIVRLSFGLDSFPVRVFMLGHFATSFSIDKTRFFNNTINHDDDFIDYRISKGITQNSLYFGPSISLPPIRNFRSQLNFGAGVNSIRIPSVYFGCDNCFEPQMYRYSPHGGLGFGGIVEGSIAYMLSEKMRFAMTFSYHSGRVQSTSVETWLTGEGWISEHDMPVSNSVSWKNTLLCFSFVYAVSNSNDKGMD